jgi:hypothetical protein
VVAPEGHENYLKGRYYWNKRSHKSLTRAIGYFSRVRSDCGPTAGLWSFFNDFVSFPASSRRNALLSFIRLGSYPEGRCFKIHPLLLNRPAGQREPLSQKWGSKSRAFPTTRRAKEFPRG